MELTRTINSDKRYYLDETNIVNAASFLKTMRVFNDAKIRMYNALYNRDFLRKGPMAEQDLTSSQFLKPIYHLNDYYNAAIYTAASGQLSSQKELKKYYHTTITADLEARDQKIQTVQEELDKKRAVKNSLRIYAKEKRWVKPYPKCQLKIHGNKAIPFGNAEIPVDVYERKVEADIRKLKTRLALVKESRKRKAGKLKNNETLPPKRIVFGGRKLYSEKDASQLPELRCGAKASETWKTGFQEKRCSSMSLPGRHTSKYGNFLCKYDGKDLSVTCMDGTVTVFRDFRLSLYEDAFLKNFSCGSKERQSICYNFLLKRDRKGRQYLIVSVTMKLSSDENIYYGNGAVAMDINYDHFVLSELDETGKLMDIRLIPFDLVGKSTGQITSILGLAVEEAFNWCKEKDKRLIVEDIDMTVKLASRRYGNRTGNHHMTLFAYQRIARSIENQSLKTHIAFRKVNPAYTSQIGKILFMREYGISVHTAASYVIGLVGLNLYEKLSPDPRMLELLKDKEGNIPGCTETTYRALWSRINKAFAGIRKHCFYRQIPYDILAKKKRPSLKSLAAEMKVRYMPAYE